MSFDTRETPLPPGLPAFEAGTVWLCGAGPGDPGMLTLAAWAGLQQADVVVHDSLVDRRVLSLAGAGALMEHAGKRGGRPSTKQRAISERLVELAQAGKRVLRLKGGDPFVFGRGGEEALALVRAGVSFRVVPGITAAVGGLAQAGIPLTHRDTNAAVTFITGHNTDGVVPDGLNWDSLATGAPVLVLYMALKHLPGIVERLRSAGRPADEPVALVSQATTADQAVLESDLAHVVADQAHQGVEPPALVVVGPVVGLRSALDWLGALEDGRELDADPLQQGRDRRVAGG